MEKFTVGELKEILKDVPDFYSLETSLGDDVDWGPDVLNIRTESGQASLYFVLDESYLGPEGDDA